MHFSHGWAADLGPWMQVCYDPATMMIAGTIGQIGGTLYKGYAAKAEGKRAAQISSYNADLARQEGEFTGKQLDRAANEERVAAQRAAFEQQHKTKQVMSTIRANAAASGAGGIETPTVLDIMGDTIARGEYLEEVERYGGESRARGREDQAAAARAGGLNKAMMLELEGDMAKTRGRNAFTGSILESIGTGAKGYYAYKNPGGKSKSKSSEEDGYWYG